jgi:hypothetical protein
VRSVALVETGIFFWSFIAIVYFVIINIALAVILEVYADIKHENDTHFKGKREAISSEGDKEE